MTSILEGVIQRGTARSLRFLGRAVAGKTGTNAWFIGYSPDLEVGVFSATTRPSPWAKRRTHRCAYLRRVDEGTLASEIAQINHCAATFSLSLGGVASADAHEGWKPCLDWITTNSLVGGLRPDYCEFPP